MGCGTFVTTYPAAAEWQHRDPHLAPVRTHKHAPHAYRRCRRYISRNQDLAVQYYDVLTKAVDDPGVTVRKRAVRLLWECCVRCADNFPYRTDAVVRIMAKAADAEEAMRSLVVKICSEIWFLSKITLGVY